MTGTNEVVKLSERIAKARGDMALSQVEFAELLEVTPRTIWNYENGRRTPQGFMLRKLARRTRKPLEFFTEAAA